MSMLFLGKEFGSVSGWTGIVPQNIIKLQKKLIYI